ncbi:MAG: hypothetical protein A2X86_17750 [Bdellovibrionales bacterium GWA2_49_15]|nr:MAG: hypothetical protein A2X86_17750 [Bdellovibrionales bacterium GWA2_49_15]HAZ14985.1 hypothetical protein [Bdellovibrionales bacterium]
MASSSTSKLGPDLLVISPKYRPDRGGLSDYTFYFLQNFHELFPERTALLLTTASESIKNYSKDDPRVLAIIPTWGFGGLRSLTACLLQKKPKTVLIQYVPYMYGKAGINFFFPLWVLFARLFLRQRFHLMAHELFHPSEFSLKGQILFWSHLWMLAVLGFASHAVFCSTKHFAFLVRIVTLGLRHPVVLPVGPNIARAVGPYSLTPKNIVLFGSAHPSKNYSLVLKCLEQYFKADQHSYRLLIIGQSAEDIKSVCARSNFSLEKHFWEHTQCLGELPENKVAEIFATSHLSINYFVDGISLRRGSAISALNSGVPVVTTLDKKSDSIFFDQPFMFLFPPEEKLFRDALLSFLHSYKNLEAEALELLRKQAMEFVDQEFAWKVIVTKYERYLK